MSKDMSQDIFIQGRIIQGRNTIKNFHPLDQRSVFSDYSNEENGGSPPIGLSSTQIQTDSKMPKRPTHPASN